MWKAVRRIGFPDSWRVEVDGEPVDFELTRARKYTLKGFVRGLANGATHTISVRGVSDQGPGLPRAVTATTLTGPARMPAPTVRPGRSGGDRTVRVSWGTPDWGGAPPCCFRITAVGKGPADKPVTIERFAASGERSLDFGVGSVGPWRFAIEAKTGAGFSPLSAYSTKVAGR